jgi:hypothetical protein
MSPIACTDVQSETEMMKAPPIEIIGGQRATSASLNHTGALVVEYDGEIEPFCTATLIAPETVVTAKHCAEIAEWGYDVYFGVGPDAYLPDELIQVASFDTAPLDDGGFVGMGRDVAVMYLDHTPESNITPVAPKPSAELNTGDRMVSLGYGVFTARDNYDGRRRIGRETVVSKEGLTFEAMLGDFESFVEWWFTGDVTDEDYLEIVDDEEYISYLMDLYESEVLMAGDEIVSGGGANDTQSCYGDSGGPLMKYVSGSGWGTFGVVSGGLNSNQSVCDYGTVFATFGPEVMSFLEAAQTWEDPCGDLGPGGTCDGNTAVNCVTNLVEKVRTFSEQNCDEVNKTCVLLDDGAYCGIVPNSSSQAETPAAEVDLHTAVEETLKDAYFYQP